MAPLDRPVTRQAVDQVLHDKLAGAFTEVRPVAIKHIYRHRDLIDDDDDDGPLPDPSAKASYIASGVDLTALIVAGVALALPLENVARDAGTDALSCLTDRSDLTQQVDQTAAGLARSRAAELVGRQWVGGELVDNPDAKFAITDTTRDMLRATIANGLHRGASAGEVANSMATDPALSDSRANLIARTEVSTINNQANLIGLRAARDDAGMPVKKSWQLGDNPCAVCQANADDGAIDLDDSFSSGDDAPPLHPNCECEVVAVTGSEN